MHVIGPHEKMRPRGVRKFPLRRGRRARPLRMLTAERDREIVAILREIRAAEAER